MKKQREIKINPVLVSGKHNDLIRMVKEWLIDLFNDDRFDILEFPQDEGEKCLDLKVVNIHPELKRKIMKDKERYINKLNEWEEKLWREKKLDISVWFEDI